MIRVEQQRRGEKTAKKKEIFGGGVEPEARWVTLVVLNVHRGGILIL